MLQTLFGDLLWLCATLLDILYEYGRGHYISKLYYNGVMDSCAMLYSICPTLDSYIGSDAPCCVVVLVWWQLISRRMTGSMPRHKAVV